MKKLLYLLVFLLNLYSAAQAQKMYGGYLDRPMPRPPSSFPANTYRFRAEFYTDGIGSSGCPSQLNFYLISKKTGAKLLTVRADKNAYAPTPSAHPCDTLKNKNIYLNEYQFGMVLSPAVYTDPEGYFITHDPIPVPLDNTVANISNAASGVQLYHELAAPTFGDITQPGFNYSPEQAYVGYVMTCKDKPLAYQHYVAFYSRPTAAINYKVSNRLVTPLTNTGLANFTGGYSATNPIAATAPVTLVDNSGGCLLTCNPNKVGVYTLCIATDFYLNNIKISTTYHQLVVDVVDCTDNPQPTIVVTKPGTSTTTAPSFCQGGSVQLNAKTTNKSATLQWRLNGQAIANAKDSIYVATQAGTYTVVATDATKCKPVQTSAPTVVTLLPNPPATITATKTSFCPNDSTLLSANTGTGLTYQWQLDGAAITGATKQTLYAKKAGSYTVVVKDANCPATSTPVVMSQLSSQGVSVSSSKNAICPNDSLTLSTATGNGLTYQWLLNGNTIAGATQATLKVKQAGSYAVTVKDGNGCSVNSTPKVISTATLPTVNAGSDQTISIGNSITLPATTSGGVTFSWQPPLGLDKTNVLNPVANPIITTLYKITVASADGCLASDDIIVNVITEPPVSIPSAFTPNDDGKNDTWELKGIEGYPNCVIEVYDRWGGKVFNSTGYSTPWDGKRNSQFMPVATYYYVIRLNGSSANTADTNMHGTVTIVK
ncbi:MAG: gliding motility-associated C-terminal domain-containing protein [Spirosomataceae bacterium]